MTDDTNNPTEADYTPYPPGYEEPTADDLDDYLWNHGIENVTDGEIAALLRRC